ncbi:protein CLEC16A isoform X1 [Gadus macrocephalus]|uniref:protein CLEC16A isoform X1 n=2 Tax=Gadus macrocephalus TaxID=80720 RepID=UPI0028CB66CE|nr:protein CLEC16A isoform X1 [Gadus macrocephalus]
MFGRSRSWVGGQGKAKNIHSLEHLKYMYHVLTKNTTVTEHNRNLLVESIRSITEILIWGDQNDSSVFDFFLEKNMFAFFLNILRQKSGRYVCVQLLQTLNILFENISHETSLYYLLSNNHVNSIIVHKFDFSDEEIMAYYISFLKTLSLKLNNHTVHFFYNEHTNDFALYTEAIKFFNHPESMVRIAVRTITLNVYQVDNKHMLHYIRDKTAVPYFSNLVWFIGSHVIELDKCVQTDEEHRNRGKLSDLVAEHLDHLHYLNDILIINCEFLNDVLTDHLLNRLFLPLYVYSLVNPDTSEERKINPQVSLYLLSQVFLIIHYRPLVNSLAEVVLNGDLSVFTPHMDARNAHKTTAGGAGGVRRFTKPSETLERSLEIHRQRGRQRAQKRPNYKNLGEGGEEEETETATAAATEDRTGTGGGGGGEEGGWEDDLLRGERERGKGTDGGGGGGSSKPGRASGERAEEIEMVVMEKCKVSDMTEQNTTDEEKTAAATRMQMHKSSPWLPVLPGRPFLDMVFSALDCSHDDYHALFVLCLLYAVSHSQGINSALLERLQLPVPQQERCSYSQGLVERLIRVTSQASQPDGKVRLATLELSCVLLKQSVLPGNHCIIKDVHLACMEGAREESLHLLRRFYKGEEIFLDMFEDEYRSMTCKPLNVEYLMMDASILLPPTGTPLTGIDFVKRLPCGDVEKTRRAIRVFFMLRALSLQLQGEPETQLPLTRPEDLIKTDDVLDLNNSDLIACMVVSKDGGQAQRFLAVDVYQMSLVEPETKRLGWGVVKFAGLLQDMQVSGVEDDSRALSVVIHKPGSNPHAKPMPILQANFIFADHIRCIIAKQRLAKGRIQARRTKMQRIAALLELPMQPGSTDVLGFAQPGHASPGGLPFRFYEQSRRAPNDPTASRALFASVDKVPGFAVAHCVAQHSPSPLSSPSPPSSSGTGSTGSTGRCDSVAASTISSRSPADDSTFLENTPPSSSGGEGGGEGVGAPSTPPPQHHHHHHQWALAPSLTPASQPSISLLTDGGGADTLGVESLTLLPPAPLPLGPPSSIAEEEEEEEEGGEEGEGEGPGDAAATPLADFQGGDSTAGDGPQETREEEEDDDDEEEEEGETHSQPTDALDSPELD